MRKASGVMWSSANPWDADALMAIARLQTHPTQRAEAIPPTQRPPDMRPIRRNGRVLKLCTVCRRFVPWSGPHMRFDGFQSDDVERIELRTHRECGGTLAMVTATTEDER